MEQEDIERRESQDLVATQSLQISIQQRKLERLLEEDEEAGIPTESVPADSSPESSEEWRPTGKKQRTARVGREAWRKLRVKIAKVSTTRKVEAYEAGKALVSRDLEDDDRVGATLVHQVGGIRAAKKNPIRELGRSFKRGINSAIRDYLKRPEIRAAAGAYSIRTQERSRSPRR